MIFLQNSAGIVKLQPDIDGLLVVTQKGYDFQNFQKLSNKIIELTEVQDVETLLIDARDADIMPQGVISWIEQAWYPSIIQTTIRRIAFVVPSIGIAEMMLRKANRKLEAISTIEIEYFGAWDNAKEWCFTE